MELYKIRPLACIAALSVASCVHKGKITDLTGSNYPADVAAIILNKCAISGCHNDLSYINAAGLRLATWDNLFAGSSSGSTVIPYRPDFSSMCFFTNTFTDLGIALQPTMPNGRQPLTRAEYQTLRSWIASGAASFTGQIKFADDASRKKFYVTNRLCNVITVIDAASRLQMRYVDVGDGATAKYPYCIKVSPDKKYWYVSFFTQCNYVQKFSADSDKLVGQIDLGSGTWTSFAISADSKHGWFVDNSAAGKVVYVDLDNMSVLATYDFGGNLKYPTGIALNETLRKLYVGALNGNYVYNIDITDPFTPVVRELPIDGTGIVQYQPSLGPVELISDLQSSKCYLACVESNEVRVVDMVRDSLLDSIYLGANPAFLGFSEASQKLFVSCPDDTASFPGNRGAITIIDGRTCSVVKRVKSGYQPYGLAVDDETNVVAVVNANISAGGPASHHVSSCGLKNGNVTFIDLSTLKLIPSKNLEVAVFPFGAAGR